VKLTIVIFVILIGLHCAAQTNPSHSSARNSNGVWSVLSFGAACNWNGSGGTDDTVAFQTAATAAASAYAKTGAVQTVTFPNGCVVGGTVRYGSGVRWTGNGTIYVPKQSGPTLYALNADDVAWNNVNITVVNSGADSPLNAAILWSSSSTDSAVHTKVAVHNCHITGSAWGISILYDAGSGSLSDVEVSGNTVKSTAVYTNWDGIHLAGTMGRISIHDNYVLNRGDAGIALTSEFQNGKHYVVNGAKVWNNILLEDLVGLDDSGATNAEWNGNYVKATTSRAGAQNPAFRQIYYGSTYPTDVQVLNNYLYSGNNFGTSPTVKIDPAADGQKSWPTLNSIFERNTIDGPNAPLYVRGTGLIVNNNILLSGGQFTIDYDGKDNVATSDLVIGTNFWMREGRVVAGLGCALYRNVKFSPEKVQGPVTFSNLSCLGVGDGIAPSKSSTIRGAGNPTAVSIPCIRSVGPPVLIGRCSQVIGSKDECMCN
jgi:hypothetical protein